MMTKVPCLNPEVCGVKAHISGSQLHMRCMEKNAQQSQKTKQGMPSVAPPSMSIKPEKLEKLNSALESIYTFLGENEQYGDDWDEEKQALDEIFDILNTSQETGESPLFHFEPYEGMKRSRDVLSDPKAMCEALSVDWEQLEQYGRERQEEGVFTPVNKSAIVNGQKLEITTSESAVEWNNPRYEFSVTSQLDDGSELKVVEERDFNPKDSFDDSARQGRVKHRHMTVTQPDGTEIWLHQRQNDISISHPDSDVVEFAFKDSARKETNKSPVATFWSDEEITKFHNYAKYLDSFDEEMVNPTL